MSLPTPPRDDKTGKTGATDRGKRRAGKGRKGGPYPRGLFIIVSKAAALDKRVTDGAFRIHAILQLHADGHGQLVFPGVETLAEKSARSGRHVLRALGLLERLGHLAITPRVKSGRGKVGNYYRAIFVAEVLDEDGGRSDTAVTSGRGPDVTFRAGRSDKTGGADVTAVSLHHGTKTRTKLMNQKRAREDRADAGSGRSLTPLGRAPGPDTGRGKDSREARHDRAARRPVPNGKHQPEKSPMTDRPNAWLFDMDWVREHVPAAVVEDCRRMLAPHLPPEAVDWMLVEFAACTSYEGILPDFGLAVAALVESMELAAAAAASGVPVDELPLGPHHGRRYASVLERKRAASEPPPPAKAVEVEEPAAAPQTVEKIIARLGEPTPADLLKMRLYEHRHHGKPWNPEWGPNPDGDPADEPADGGDK